VRKLHRVRKKGATLFLHLSWPNAKWFSQFFTGRLASSFLKSNNNYLTKPETCRYTTLRNVCAQKSQLPRDERSDARLSHSKQLLTNIHPMTLASFCSPMNRHIQWPKNPQDDQLYAYPSNKKKDVQSLRASIGLNRNLMLLQQFLSTIYVRSQASSSDFFIFQEGSVSAHRALEAINFFP